MRIQNKLIIESMKELLVEQRCSGKNYSTAVVYHKQCKLCKLRCCD